MLRHLKAILIAGAFIVTLSTGCDASDGLCTSDYDCADKLVCELNTGKCATYGCDSCKLDEQCVDNACAPK